MEEPEVRTDLYRGTTRDYDRCRPACPPGLIADLAARSGADGRGRLLGLACGPGPVVGA